MAKKAVELLAREAIKDYIAEQEKKNSELEARIRRLEELYEPK